MAAVAVRNTHSMPPVGQNSCANSAPRPSFHPERAKNHPGIRCETIEQIAQSAQRVLEHIETNCHEVDGFVQGFVENVNKYAQRAQQGDSTSMTKVLDALRTISKRLDGLEKTASSSTSTQSTDSATFWRSLRMQGWQRGTDGTFSPVSGPTGSSSPGVDEIELQEDRQVIIKIADQGSRERFGRRDFSENDIVKQVSERELVALAVRTPSSPIAAVAVAAARKLPSGDIALYTRTAAAAEVLRVHARGWVARCIWA